MTSYRGLLLGSVFAMTAAIGSTPATSAFAADASTASTSSPTSNSDQSEVEGLVVTGSRIPHDNFSSAAPVEVITTQQSRLQGIVDPTQILQTSPVAAGSVQINNQFSQFVVNGGAGVNTISLRGLGSQRTLVLLNGRRLNPAGVSGTVAAVDLNVIPSALIDRYEILKDGASSIYGSDAIGGVVNIITKNKFDGLEVEADGAVPGRNGGSTYDFAVSGGRVRDNYHILFGGEYYKQNRIHLGSRPFGVCPSDLYRNPATGVYDYDRQYADGTPYCAFTQTNYVESLTTGATYVYDPSQPSSFPYVPFHQGSYPAIPRITNIATDPNERNTDILSPVSRTSAVVIGSVDTGAHSEFYFEGIFTNRKSNQDAYVPQFFVSSLDDVLALGFNPFNRFVGDFPDSILTLPVEHYSQNVNAGRVVLGFKGDFPSGFMSKWRYDASVTYGLSRATYTIPYISTARVENALDVVVAPAGTPAALRRLNPVDGQYYTCSVNVTNPNAGCYPIDWFVSSASFAKDPAYAYINQLDHGRTNYDQVVASAYINGPLFNMPAGALQAVFGAEFRYDKLFDYQGDGSFARDYFGQSTSGLTQGNDHVWEVYGELEAPLLKGRALFESLTLNVSGRYTDYKTAGSDGTYKVGLNWQVVPWLRARATYGTSFRGPALFENYLAGQTSFTGAADPCRNYGEVSSPGDPLYTNCMSEGQAPDGAGYFSTPQVFTQGANGRLRPETSKNFTGGIIFQPSFADLEVSVDYFHIEVDNQIANFGASYILDRCYGSTLFRNGDPFCALISPRDGNGDIPFIDDSYVNIARQQTAGVDLEVKYKRQLPWWDTKLDFDWQGTVTTTDATEYLPGTGLQSYNGTFGDPKLVWNAQILLKRHAWTFAWNMQYIGGTDVYALSGIAPGGQYKLDQPSIVYNDLSLTYEADKWKFTAGVRNVGDVLPPLISNNSTGVAPRYGEVSAGYGTYDFYGRTFFMNLTKDF
ncbi:TonB-dependent receptor domain-containing protein [Caulobacter sp. KR2-114]|uniref:TonB-dependent receptor plug domain-containing protein n=1 Tax=Caulobacter sp. KR2-114 TaxID=3400912 RepID=UPI003C0A70F8